MLKNSGGDQRKMKEFKYSRCESGILRMADCNQAGKMVGRRNQRIVPEVDKIRGIGIER